MSPFEIRIALYARAALPYLAALDRPGLAVCDVIDDAAALPARLAALEPHVLVLAERPSGAEDLPRAIAAAARVRPPRVVACFDAPWADACLPCDLAGCVRAVMARPCARFSVGTLPAREKIACGLLDGLGMARTLGGYACIAHGAALLSALPPPAPPVQQWLYPHLAARFGLSAAAVERRIRSAIESAWLRGNLPAQSALLGLSVSAERGKPTNGELLFRLAERVGEGYEGTILSLS